MAGIYLHIPFCRQACHYCNFHFATSLLQKSEMVEAIRLEIDSRKEEFSGETIETIYFGGGTPSLLSLEELQRLLSSIRQNYKLAKNAEVTLEVNPDDIDEEKLKGWKLEGINRLSIGVQSFFQEDLDWMNRAHNSKQAIEGLKLAAWHFDNITVDLIYGSPGLTHEKWEENVRSVLELDIPHISCYALTVEEKTPLAKMIRESRSVNVDPEIQAQQFLLLMKWMEMAGYEHYEISNFAKPGFRSRHNSSYWGSAPGKAKKYLGIGPAAHSYNGTERAWNISNNVQYIRSTLEGKTIKEIETLNATQELNEYIMTSIRTMEGIDISLIPAEQIERILRIGEKFIVNGLMKKTGDHLHLTKEGRLLADGIAADLFL